jgi:hypothetical protein
MAWWDDPADDLRELRARVARLERECRELDRAHGRYKPSHVNSYTSHLQLVEKPPPKASSM